MQSGSMSGFMEGAEGPDYEEPDTNIYFRVQMVKGFPDSAQIEIAFGDGDFEEAGEIFDIEITRELHAILTDALADFGQKLYDEGADMDGGY